MRTIYRSSPAHRWELANDKRNGGILCVDNYDITGDGILDLIIGRDDGLVEIYGYDEMDEPLLRHSQVWLDMFPWNFWFWNLTEVSI